MDLPFSDVREIQWFFQELQKKLRVVADQATFDQMLCSTPKLAKPSIADACQSHACVRWTNACWLVSLCAAKWLRGTQSIKCDRSINELALYFHLNKCFSSIYSVYFSNMDGCSTTIVASLTPGTPGLYWVPWSQSCSVRNRLSLEPS